jgi:hypothetical protein
MNGSRLRTLLRRASLESVTFQYFTNIPFYEQFTNSLRTFHKCRFWQPTPQKYRHTFFDPCVLNFRVGVVAGWHIFMFSRVCFSRKIAGHGSTLMPAVLKCSVCSIGSRSLGLPNVTVLVLFPTTRPSLYISVSHISSEFVFV